jgi:para-aminobenzoate synthetase component 1
VLGAAPQRPLVALFSGGQGEHAGPSLVAHPTKTLQLPAGSTLAQWREFANLCGLSQRVRCESRAKAASFAHSAGQLHAPSIAPGWVYCLSFELGELFEPSLVRTPAHRARPPRGLGQFPLAVAFRVETALDRAPDDVSSAHPQLALLAPTANDRHAYEQGVARCLAYIRAGDVYQVNLAHVLRGRLAGSPRALATSLWRVAQPWFGAFLELPHGQSKARAIASASPELFLRYQASTQRLSSRPMKGTRRAHTQGAHELATSEKDKAELAMIVDLMRNDLGRVCELGSMRVDTPRAIETHGTQHAALLQATATISGTPAREATWASVLEACFPPGSVTGAPKVRAVQILRELEPSLRGPYCGCIGFVSDAGDSAWSVAIRTAATERDEQVREEQASDATWDVAWHVGAGIVADSSPQQEWEETLAKASVLRAACSQG